MAARIVYVMLIIGAVLQHVSAQTPLDTKDGQTTVGVLELFGNLAPEPPFRGLDDTSSAPEPRWHSFSTGDAAATVIKVYDGYDLGPAVAAQLDPEGPKVFIVKFRPGVDVDAATTEIKAAHGAGEMYRYRHALRGAALVVENSRKAAQLAADPRVDTVMADGLVRGGDTVAVDTLASLRPQPPQVIPAGIARVGATETDNEGEGVVVAVIDSGIELDHPDLVANIHPTIRADFVGDGTTQRNPGNDPLWHGTHVSGAIGAADNGIGVIGVVSKVELIPVRVLNKQGVGTWAQIIAGIDWVTEHAAIIRVANMSIGDLELNPNYDDGNCGYTNGDLVHQAICASVASGLTIVAGAGNDSVDASNQRPASYDEVITVAAYWHNPSGLDPAQWDPSGDVGFDVGFPDWSNYGADVDIAAPGVNVWSTTRHGRYEFAYGTSMAAPHVAAAAAMYIYRHPNATPAQVRDAIIRNGENGYLDQYPDNPDSLHAEPLLDVRRF
jgi:subtilisin family serine protease